MSRITLLILALLVTSQVAGQSLFVVFDSGPAPEPVQVATIGGVRCFPALALNRVFGASVSDDLPDRRLRVTLYGEQFIFLIDSPYVNHGSNRFNCTWPVRRQGDRYYLPLTFLTQILPLALPDKIRYDVDARELHAALPMDNTISTIYIDPGHGGKDPGALGYTRGVFEKDVVLSVALMLKERLERELDGVKVVLTRDDDTFIPLNARSRMANEGGGDLFISLHCNAHRDRSCNGVEVYFLSTAKTTDERAVEALENSVVYKYEGGAEALQRYDDLSFILMDMAQTEQLHESSELAYKLLANMVSTTSMNNRGVRQANLYVLRVSYMPAVLVELGFISNRSEEKRLLDAEMQQNLVEALAEGIKSFKYKYDQVR
ncbi:MAG: N-acetylmuramoyl-L-alanine amidase [Candidatus Cloacimonetes bacterium]|nr:N-acetylmuramoyl-L-alanine amidase [Candidatus Cloacimonadota bacterium]